MTIDIDRHDSINLHKDEVYGFDIFCLNLLMPKYFLLLSTGIHTFIQKKYCRKK